MDYTELLVVLAWIAGGAGGIYLAGKVLPYLYELIPQWDEKLSSRQRRFIAFLVAAGLSFGAQAILDLVPGDTLNQIGEVYEQLASFVLLWLGSQAEYADKVRYTTKRFKNGS